MSFLTPPFFPFLGLLALCAFLTPKRLRWVALLAGSWVFYLSASQEAAVYLLLSSAAAFLAALRIEALQARYQKQLSGAAPDEKKCLRERARRQKRGWLAVALVFIFGLLVALKYMNFVIGNANALLGLFGAGEIAKVNWLLPLGISFYTLQVSGYLIDVYRGKYAADRNFPRFLLFVSWFPQLLQGPIGRYDHLAAQLYEGHDFDWQRMKSGVLRMAWGYFKKFIIADRLATVVAPIFFLFARDGYFGAYIWVSAILYSFQIYADFSAGMDIALGISEIFGIRLTENFRRPLLAHSVADFWQRWHITLGAWMRDYLFYPLALSKRFARLGKRLRKRFGPYVAKVAPACLASLIVFTCVGVWHGAEWKYVLYGFYQAVFVSTATLLEPLYARARERLHVDANARWFHVFQMLRTFAIITVGRLLVRAETVLDALRMLKGAFQEWNPQILWNGAFLALSESEAVMGPEWVVIGVAMLLWMVVEMLNERGVTVRAAMEKRPLALRWTFYILAVMTTLIFGRYGQGFSVADFVYGQF